MAADSRLSSLDSSAMTVPYAPDQVPTGARRRLLDRAPAGAVVLDVGCWSGFNGRYLIEHHRSEMIGIEPNRDMAARARPDYVTVHTMTIEEALNGVLDGQTFDLVLLLDVLEHLIAPEAVLRGLRRHLARDGHVLIS